MDYGFRATFAESCILNAAGLLYITKMLTSRYCYATALEIAMGNHSEPLNLIQSCGYQPTEMQHSVLWFIGCRESYYQHIAHCRYCCSWFTSAVPDINQLLLGLTSRVVLPIKLKKLLLILLVIHIMYHWIELCVKRHIGSTSLQNQYSQL